MFEQRKRGIAFSEAVLACTVVKSPLEIEHLKRFKIVKSIKLSGGLPCNKWIEMGYIAWLERTNHAGKQSTN